MAESTLVLSRWQPALGAWIRDRGVSFRVWAPTKNQVDLLLEPGCAAQRCERLQRSHDGTFVGTFETVKPGDLYMYRVDGEGPYPDPCSRFQPQGVHGPSAVIDPSEFDWSDREWQGVPLERAVIYELHVGTFTPAGTFAGVAARLPYLAELGVTAIQLMPVADFPGTRNWGYDGVSLFAPCRQYGTPDDLRRLVDAAHRTGIAVLFDVVYNHFGPDGAYGGVFSPFYRSPRHHSPWGAAINLDGAHSDAVRAFFIENALHWLHEYHADGLRLDATHWLQDDSNPHFVAELAQRVREATDRPVLLVSEDDRNLATIVRQGQEGGWGMDAVWADDFHHHVRRRSAGDCDGYYQDYSGAMTDVAATLRHGWFYCGQYSEYAGASRGTSPAGVPLERMIICLQNHDQIGNRPFGRRLHHQIDPALYRALSALLLFSPETPLLFMGQEWAASTPFLFFTDHNPELGRLVTEGRRREFARFKAFADEETRSRIPDPQAATTFEASRLCWDERVLDPHAGTLKLYRSLLSLRQTEPALNAGSRFAVVELDDDGLALTRTRTGGDGLMLVVWLGGSGTYEYDHHGPTIAGGQWTVVLSTEEARFRSLGESTPAPEITAHDPLLVTFHGPAAMILRRE
jgi:maltooligosyltrehalose trehalohydrolase